MSLQTSTILTVKAVQQLRERYKASCVVPDLHHFLFLCPLLAILLLLLPLQLHLRFAKMLTEKNVFQGYIPFHLQWAAHRRVSHLQSSVIFLLLAPLLFGLPPPPFFLHLLLNFLQPVPLFLLLLLLLHGGEELLGALHQPLVVCVNLFPGDGECGLERVKKKPNSRSSLNLKNRYLKYPQALC